MLTQIISLNHILFENPRIPYHSNTVLYTELSLLHEVILKQLNKYYIVLKKKFDTLFLNIPDCKVISFFLTMQLIQRTGTKVNKKSYYFQCPLYNSEEIR